MSLKPLTDKGVLSIFKLLLSPYLRMQDVLGLTGKKITFIFYLEGKPTFPFWCRKSPSFWGGVGVQNEGQERSEKCLFE